MDPSASQFLTNRLGIGHPIIQAPMAGVSSPAMAAAVSNAGGLGSIGVGASDAATACRLVAAIRERSQRPFNVNVFCHHPAPVDDAVAADWIERLRPEFGRYGAEPPRGLTEIYRSFCVDDAMVAVLLETRPAVASFHFGIPSRDCIRALRQAGIVLLGSATNLQEGRCLVEAGVHAIIAQGWEAGGHRGMFDPDADDERLGTLPLVSRLVSELSVPIVAAGGLMDGADIAQALRAGASAAQLGTAFIACAESLADEGYRAALFSEAAHHTVMTRAISGRPARCLANRFTDLGSQVEARQVPAYPIAYDLGKALNAAARGAGEAGYGAQWAGTGAPRARAMPAGDLVTRLAEELSLA